MYVYPKNVRYSNGHNIIQRIREQYSTSILIRATTVGPCDLILSVNVCVIVVYIDIWLDDLKRACPLVSDIYLDWTVGVLSLCLWGSKFISHSPLRRYVGICISSEWGVRVYHTARSAHPNTYLILGFSLICSIACDWNSKLKWKREKIIDSEIQRETDMQNLCNL